MKILGVWIDNLTKKEILEKVEFFLNEDKFHQIATVNPEFILRAQRDEEFKNILNKTDLNVADGVGIWYAFLKYANHLKSRTAGIDLMQEILEIADKKGLSVFLAIHKNGLSSLENIKKSLNAKYPNVGIFGDDVDPRKTKKMLLAINHPIVFCNFGFPQQEKFINLLKNRQNSNLQLTGCQGKIRLAMGVGGSFDFITEKIKRAPLWMRKVGLEWLWRLLFQSWTDKFFLVRRWRRIFNAVLVFPIKIIFSTNK